MEKKFFFNSKMVRVSNKPNMIERMVTKVYIFFKSFIMSFIQPEAQTKAHIHQLKKVPVHKVSLSGAGCGAGG